MGDKKLPGISSEDIGKSAYQIFKAGTKYQGKTISIAGDHKTGQEMADTFTKILGVKVKYNEVTPETYRGFGFPGADDIGNMFQFKRDFNEDYVGARDLSFSKSLNPELLDFESWLKQNKDKIPVG